MLKIFAYAVLLTHAPAYVHASAPNRPVKFDPPDLNLEFQMHRQYILSRGQAPIAQQGQFENYSLQKGETLWGLSQMLYGDGNYWPKVWAHNQAITNPHLIRPGHTLQFLLGSEDDTPAFRFAEGDDSALELAAASVTVGGGGAPVTIPPPEIAPRPVIKVPPSFPDYTDIYRKHKDDIEIDDSKMVYERKLPPDKFPLSAYVQDTPVVSYGNFLETVKESGLPVEGQYVFVRIRKGSGSQGQKYLVVKDQGVIRKINRQVEGKITSHFIQIFGQIDLIEKVESHFRRSRDNEEFEAWRGLLVKAMNLSLTNYELIPGEVETVSMAKDGVSGPGGAQLIGSSKHHSSELYGPGDIVFLNRGSANGFAPGQLFDLTIDRAIRDIRTPVNFSGTSSGMLKVVKVAQNCSTGVILSSVDSIQQGDRVVPYSRLSGGASALPSREGGDGFDAEDPGSGSGAPPSPESGDEFDLSE